MLLYKIVVCPECRWQIVIILYKRITSVFFKACHEIYDQCKRKKLFRKIFIYLPTPLHGYQTRACLSSRQACFTTWQRSPTVLNSWVGTYCVVSNYEPNFKATNFGSCFGLRTSWFSYYLQFMQEFVQFFLCKHWQSDFTAPVTNWKGSIRCFAGNLVGKIGKTKRFVLIYINVSFNSLG